jgi:hypothetical protein
VTAASAQVASETYQTATDNNVDPVDLQGAVNTTGLDALEYLWATGEVDRPQPVVVVAVAPVSSVWTRLKGCESPGLGWNANTGNGFEGGIQFLNSTWHANGGGRYAQHAYQASADQQIAVGATLLARSGGRFTAWPGCRAKLGLP